MGERLKPQPTQLDSSRSRVNLLAGEGSRPITPRKKRKPKLYAPRWFESSWSKKPDIH